MGAAPPDGQTLSGSAAAVVLPSRWPQGTGAIDDVGVDQAVGKLAAARHELVEISSRVDGPQLIDDEAVQVPVFMSWMEDEFPHSPLSDDPAGGVGALGHADASRRYVGDP